MHYWQYSINILIFADFFPEILVCASCGFVHCLMFWPEIFYELFGPSLIKHSSLQWVIFYFFLSNIPPCLKESLTPVVAILRAELFIKKITEWHLKINEYGTYLKKDEQYNNVNYLMAKTNKLIYNYRSCSMVSVFSN